MNCFVARCKHYSVALPRKPAAQPLYNVIAANYINPKKKTSPTKKIFPIIWFVLKYFPMSETQFIASFKGLVWMLLCLTGFSCLGFEWNLLTHWCWFYIGVMLSYGTICVQWLMFDDIRRLHPMLMTYHKYIYM